MTNYLNAKNGIEILHGDGLTQILSGNGNPSLLGLEANIGSVFLRSDSPSGLYNKIGPNNTDWELLKENTNLDGGSAGSIYGGTTSIDGGSASTIY